MKILVSIFSAFCALGAAGFIAMGAMFAATARDLPEAGGTVLTLAGLVFPLLGLGLHVWGQTGLWSNARDRRVLPFLWSPLLLAGLFTGLVFLLLP